MLCSLANALGGKFKKNASKMAFKMVSTLRRKMVSLARGTEVVAGFLMTELKAGVARVARNVVSEARLSRLPRILSNIFVSRTMDTRGFLLLSMLESKIFARRYSEWPCGVKNVR